MILGLTGLLFHEMWVDEARAWLIATDVPLKDLFQFLSYEKQPPLWYLLIKSTSIFYKSPYNIQVLSFIFGVVSFSLVLFKSPFNNVQKFLLVFNYYLLYEFMVISRSYSLEILLLFALCSLFDKKKDYPGLYVFCCGLLACTNIFGIVISSFFMLDFVIELRKSKEQLISKGRALFYFLVGLYLMILVLTLFGLQSPVDGFAKSAPLDFNWSKLSASMTRYFESIFLVANLSGPQWTFTPLSSVPIFTLIGPGLFLFLISYLCFLVFKIRRAFFFLFYTGGLFFLINYLNVYSYDSRRHTGQLILAIMASFWLCLSKQRQSSKKLNYFLILMLSFQAIAGAVSVWRDINERYSNGYLAAQVINSEKFANYEIIADAPFFSSSYVALTDKKFFDIESSGYVRFIPVTNFQAKSLELENFVAEPFPVLRRSKTETLIERVNIAKNKNKNGVLLVTNYPVTSEVIKSLNVTRVNVFEEAINPYENFYVYKAN